MEYSHKPVLLDESLAALDIKPDGVYADLTLGRAGHSYEIAKKLTTGTLIGVDRDITAIEAGHERLAEFGERVKLVKSDFREAADKIRTLGFEKIDGVLMDLGVSSPQLDEAERGFSYMADAPLDMRMDRDAALTAYDIINGWGKDELRRILTEYGEERFSSRIAGKIIEARPVNTTFELVEIIKSAMPAAALREKQHPAKRSFQAIRIAVNDELGALREALVEIGDLLAVGGKLAAISFHSLEDRIVKAYITEKSKGCTCPPEFPVCVCGKTPDMKAVPKKPVLPSAEELEQNPRARSAKLRVAMKLK